MEYLRATSDEEMGKIGPSPSAFTPARKVRVPGAPGLRRKSVHTSLKSSTVGPATAFGFRLVSHPTDEDLSVGTPAWTDFRSQRHPRES